MAVKVRLTRLGSRNHPFYRLVAIDGRRAVKGKYIENLGWYNPQQKKEGPNFHIKVDRVDHWITNGAQLSESARSLVKKARIYQPAEMAPEAEPVVADEPAKPAEETAES